MDAIEEKTGERETEDTLEVSLEVWTKISPTEDTLKVRQAVLNIFPGLSLEISGDTLKGRGSLAELRTLQKLLHRQKILDTARNKIQEGRLGDTVRFVLNKQVASVEKVNFPPSPDSEPLGSIHVTLKSGDLDTLIDWLAPQTQGGVPIKEIKL